ncbi:MAG TPA: hypothetical protein VFV50_06975 [Bdellovibrionales bacterium]|nr:hypothetical protein [Bdellovibrionales bacterium]
MFRFVQFLPLTVFLATARALEFSADAWPAAFKWGAAASLVQVLALFWSRSFAVSRLVAGVNLFMFFGGLAFWLESAFLTGLLDGLRESALFLFVGVAVAFAMAVSRSGAFERELPRERQTLKLSALFLAAVLIAFIWSFEHRGDTLQAGVAPFVFLLLLKGALEKSAHYRSRD